MELQASTLRSAVQALYTSPLRSEQQRADTWLQEFRSSGDSWRLCLELLSSNTAAQDPELYFAANSLRYTCSKNQELLGEDVLGKVLSVLASSLLQSVHSNKWPVTTQLSSAIAVLVMRAPSWAPQRIIMDLEALVLSQLPAACQQQQRDVAQVAMLQVLAALPTVVNDRQCTVHPNRRLAVSEALAESQNIASWVQAAFGSVQQQLPGPARHLYLTLGLQIMHGWCEMGTLPLSATQQENIAEQVCLAITRPETATQAAETLVSMLTLAKDTASTGSDVLLRLVQHLQAAMALLQQAQQQQQHMDGGVEVIPKDVRQAACSSLCAAGCALLPAALANMAPLQLHFITVAQQLLEQLVSSDDDVALTALEFWQDTYVTTLQGLPSDARQAAMVHHTGLLQQLTAALVLRARLPPSAALGSSADARDLPEEVRRELSSALRDITCLVSASGMAAFMSVVVQSAWQQHQAAASTCPGEPSWMHLECALYAATVILGQSGSGARGSSAADPAPVAQLLDVALACVAQHAAPSSSSKLVGTALTLLGGLAQWLVDNSEPLPALLLGLSSALQSQTESLARNAATTVYRLCQHNGLAQLLLIQHRAWVEGLLQLYQASGGVRRRLGQGEDLPTEELLLAALCRLAVLPGGSSLPTASTSSLLSQLAAPKLQELQQALEALVACGPVALSMLTGASAVQCSTPALHNTKHSAAASSSPATAGHIPSTGPPRAAHPVSPGHSGRLRQMSVSRGLGNGETRQASACALQVGTCLEVLQLMTYNAMAPFRTSSSRSSSSNSDTATGSALNSSAPSPRPSMHSPGSSTTLAKPAVPRTPSLASTAPPLPTLSPSPPTPASPAAAALLAVQQEKLVEGAVVGVVGAVWDRLSQALAHLSSLPSVVGPAADLFAASLRSLVVLSKRVVPLSTPRQDPLICAVHFLDCLPPHSLLLPKVSTLLAACLEAANCFHTDAGRQARSAEPGLTPSAGFQHIGSANPGMEEDNSGSCTSPAMQPLSLPPPASHLPTAMSASCLQPNTGSEHQPLPDLVAGAPSSLLQGVSSSLLAVSRVALEACCQQVVATVDPDLCVPLLKLCCATVRFAPEVLAAPGLLEQLVAMTLHTGRSYDQEQCKLWLEWVPLLTTAPFVAASRMSSLNQLAPTASLECSPQQQHVARQAPQSAPAGGLAGRRGSATSPGVVSMAFSLEVQQRQEPLELQLSLLPAGLARLVALLDASAGAQLCLALLLAASGDMPPDLIMPIASTLHFTWTWVGTARMSAWLQAAIMDCAPASAPWAGQKADSKAAFLQDLLSQDAECDVGRFKRLVKGFCGGKKKVAGVTSMAGVSWQGARITRSVSRRSSSQLSI